MQTYTALALLLFGIVGCATAPKSFATDGSILADARSRSAAFCAKYTDGCEIKTRQRENGGWSAHVVPVERDANGRRLYGIDSDDVYIYDERGRFKSALRGY